MADKRHCNPRRMNGDRNGVVRDFAVGAVSGEPAGHRFDCGPGPERPALRARARRGLIPAGNHLAGMASPAAPAVQSPTEPMPVWFAALTAVHCRARSEGQDRAVLWDCVAGRALYTNHGPSAEIIEPLGVPLRRGDTVAVSWMPGETAYRVEVIGSLDYVA